MDNFFSPQLSQEELQRRHAHLRSQRRASRAAVMNQAPTYSHHQQISIDQHDGMAGSDSVADMVHRNQQRRRSSLPAFAGVQVQPIDNDRRLSTSEFRDSEESYTDPDWQYDFMATSPTDNLFNLNVNVNMQSSMDPNTGMAIPASANFPPGILVSGEFPPDMMGDVMTLSNMNMRSMTDPYGLNFYSSATPAGFSPSAMNSPQHDFPDLIDTRGNSLATDSIVPNATNHASQVAIENRADTEMEDSDQPFTIAPPKTKQPQLSLNLDTAMSNYQPSVSSQQPTPLPPQTSATSTPSYQSPMTSIGTMLDMGSTPAQSTAGQLAGPAAGPSPPPGKTIYSKSGFDMLRALWMVATRKSPQVHLGAVDMSCAFVVCDVTMNDCPIIYVSDNFQNLTGYSRHEIVGQNCRFLQAPDGRVVAGSKREFVDNGAVFNLKQKIAETKEIQQSIINYRKGGKPFLNLLTMIPIPWDTTEIRYIIGFQIDLVECPDAIASSQAPGSSMLVNYKHSDIGQYIWNPSSTTQWEPESGQTLNVDDVSTLLQQFAPKGPVSDWHRQSWDKMLLENADDVVHVLSLKGLFLYVSPSSKRVLEYDGGELVGTSLSAICHPSDIVPVTRELREATIGSTVNVVFRIMRKQSGYTWFESYGSQFSEAGKGRRCIILVGRKRPVFALHRRDLEAHGGIGDSELWSKLSTSGMFLFVSSNVRSLLDLQPENLVGTSIQELMRKESRPEFGRSIEKVRRGRIITCKHEVQNRRGQVLQAHTIMYPGDASEGQKPTFVLAQTKLVKASSRAIAPASSSMPSSKQGSINPPSMDAKSLGNTSSTSAPPSSTDLGVISAAAGGGIPLGTQDLALESDDNVFEELKTTRCTSWQFELRQMERINRARAERLHGLLSNKKKRKRRKGVGNVVRDCANCHTRSTPEWRRGPSGQRDLCNSCGLRWAKQMGRVSPRNSHKSTGDATSRRSTSPAHSSPLQIQVVGSEKRDFGGTESSAKTDNDQSLDSGTAPITGELTSPTTVSNPPLSQPYLEGGAEGSQMQPIREEREVST